MIIKTQDMRGQMTPFERYEIDANNFAIDFGEIINFHFQGKIFHWNKIDKTYYKYNDPEGFDQRVADGRGRRQATAWSTVGQSVCKIELTPEQEAKVKTIKMMMVLDK